MRTLMMAAALAVTGANADAAVFTYTYAGADLYDPFYDATYGGLNFTITIDRELAGVVTGIDVVQGNRSDIRPRWTVNGEVLPLGQSPDGITFTGDFDPYATTNGGSFSIGFDDRAMVSGSSGYTDYDGNLDFYHNFGYAVGLDRIEIDSTAGYFFFSGPVADWKRTVDTPQVPLPATGWMLFLAVSGLVAARSRELAS